MAFVINKNNAILKNAVPKEKIRVKSILACAWGSALELFDVQLYTHILVVISPIFFPNNDVFVNAFLSMFVYAVDYFFEFIGGIIYGQFGDTIGRRKTLINSLLFVIVPTAIIGFIPPYAQIGIAAPIILVVCRAFQKISFGGEVNLACVLATEHAPVGKKCFYAALQNVTSKLAGAFAALISFACILPFMPSWGWKIPFFVSVLFGVVGIYIRKTMVETESFNKLVEENKVVKVPLLKLLREEKRSILCVIGSCAGVLAPSSVIFVYFTSVLRTRFHLEMYQILLQSTCLLVFAAAVMPFLAKLGDKFGAKRVMISGFVAVAIVPYPLLSFVDATGNYIGIFVAQYLLTLCKAPITSVNDAFSAMQFSRAARVTGLGFAWGVGYFLFKGLTPLVMKFLEMFFGEKLVAAALYMALCAGVSIVSIYFCKEVGGKGKQVVE